MVAIPNPEPPIVSAISRAREASEPARRDSVRVSPSTLGGPCERALWYTFRWVSPAKQFDGRMLRLFETGNLQEARLIADLRRAGVTVVDRDGNRQISVEFADGHGFGYLDGECQGLPEAPVTIHVLECKTHSHRNFTVAKNGGVRKAKPEHWAQMQIYMHLRSRTRALYLIVDKDTDEVWAERVEYDAGAAMSLIVKAERIVATDRPPPRIQDTVKYPCTFCDHKGHCFEGEQPRRNCRSCLFSTPTAGGTWTCDRFERPLSTEEQKVGCPHHLLIPDLVHGKQIDADMEAGWIEYELHSGERWKDEATS